MNREKRNSKIFYLIAVLILIICSLAGTYYWKTNQLRTAIDNELSRLVRSLINDKKLESNYIKAVKAELIKQTEITLGKINYLRYSEKELSPNEAQKEIIKILKEERFETKYDKEKGYFFGYTYEGKNVFHPTKPWAGQDKKYYRDKYGKLVIQDLIKVALNNKEQGGFDIYMFHTPSSTHDIGDTGATKLSYVIALDDLQWVIGTGIHLDLVDSFLEEMDSIIHKEAAITMLQVLVSFVIGLIPAIILLTMNVKSNTYRRLSDRFHTRVQQDLGFLLRRYDEAIEKGKSESTETITISLQDIRKQKQIIQEAFDEIEIILRNHDSENPSLVYGLLKIKEKIEKRDQIPVDFYIPNILSVESLCVPRYKKTALFEFAEEALTNIGKHAFSSQIEMRLLVDNRSYSLMIRDNGIGFDLDEIPFGADGLEAMRRAIEDAAGGRFKITSSTSGPDKGTMIDAIVPRSKIDEIRCYVENTVRNLIRGDK